MHGKLLYLLCFSLLFSFASAQNKTTISGQNSDTIILMAMHGGVPKDFPRYDLGRFFQLHGKPHSSLTDQEKIDLEILDDELRNWPRSKTNDPYYSGCVELQKALQEKLSVPVKLAFNEYCAPSVEEAIKHSVDSGGVKNIIVITTMTTTGGSHSEKDIPAAIARAKEKLINKNVNIEYRWPIPLDMTVKFISEVVNLKIDKMESITSTDQ